eukprot:311981-Hanusia_phi.AAC.1
MEDLRKVAGRSIAACVASGAGGLWRWDGSLLPRPRLLCLLPVGERVRLCDRGRRDERGRGAGRAAGGEWGELGGDCGRRDGLVQEAAGGGGSGGGKEDGDGFSGQCKEHAEGWVRDRGGRGAGCGRAGGGVAGWEEDEVETWMLVGDGSTGKMSST